MQFWASRSLFGFIFLCLPGYIFAQQTDSILNTDLNAARIGNNTFAYRNALFGVIKPFTRQRIGYSITTDHIYNTAQYQNPFVSKDVLLGFNHSIGLGKGFGTGQWAFINDYGATKTRLAAYMPFLNYGFEKSKFRFFSQTKAGIVTDKRINYSNSGLGYEMLASWLLNGPDSSINTTFSAQFGQNNINPRKSNYGRAMGGIEKTYGPEASLAAGASFSSRLVEDYLAASDTTFNIQSIRSDTLNVYLNLNYRLSKWFFIRSGNLYSRPNRYFNYRSFIGPDNRVNIYYTQDELGLRQELVFDRPKVEGSIRLEYNLRDRVYGLGQNPGLTKNVIDSLLRNQGFPEVSVQDITESNTAWYYNLKYRPGRHLFTLNSVSQLLRVDTRSKLNTQDRDELLYTGEAAWATFWNSTFRTNIKLSGSWRHFVYLDAGQSIENFKERILRFEPQFRWNQGPISWNGNYNVFVTYNVRDFDSEQDRNRSNRVFITTQNVQLRLSPNYAILTDFLRRENRLSQLDWVRFRESPIDTVVIYDVTLKLQRKFNLQSGSFKVQAGYRIYRQTRSNSAGIRLAAGPRLIYQDNVTLQHGPKFIAQWDAGQRLHFQADVWLQLVRIYNTWQVSDKLYLGQTFSPDQLGIVQKNFFPYFTVGLVWNVGIRD